MNQPNQATWLWLGAASVRSTNTYTASIPYDKLPKSLQEPVVITRNPGLKSLLRDSLCILLDSPDEEEKDIARMCAVYQSSHVTIVAASASSSYSGNESLFGNISLGSQYKKPAQVTASIHRSLPMAGMVRISAFSIRNVQILEKKIGQRSGPRA